jgi:hypothetical protein
MQLSQVSLLPNFFHLSTGPTMHCNCSDNLFSTLCYWVTRTALPSANTTNFCSLSHNPSGTLPCGTTRTFLSGLHCLSTVPTPFATDQGQGIDTPQQQICLEQVTDLPQGDKVSAAVREKNPLDILFPILRDFLPWQLPQTIPDPVVSPKAWRTRAEKLCALLVFLPAFSGVLCNTMA